MAKGDFDRFRPSESAYTSPSEYATAQRSIALEKATYQSEMDQFHKDLEERRRQFDIGIGFKEHELAETSRQFDVGMELETKKAANVRYGMDLGASVDRERISATERIAGAEHQVAREKFWKEHELGIAGLESRERIAQKEHTLGITGIQSQEQMHAEGLDYSYAAMELEEEKLGFEKEKWAASFLEMIRQFDKEFGLASKQQKHEVKTDWIGVASDIVGAIGLFSDK